MSPPRQKQKKTADFSRFRQLRRGAWFGSLSEPVALALFEAGSIIEYTAGEVIYSDDGTAPGFLTTLDGAAHIETADRSGRRVLLYAASPGTWFGALAAAPRQHMLITIRAFRHTTVWRVPSTELRRLLRVEPELVDGLALLETLRQRALVEMVCMAHRPGTLSQVAGCLALIDRLYKENDAETERSVVHMTQADLADMTGHSRQTINVVVAQLEKDQLIRVGHRRIEILDAEGLDAVSESQ